MDESSSLSFTPLSYTSRVIFSDQNRQTRGAVKVQATRSTKWKNGRWDFQQASHAGVLESRETGRKGVAVHCSGRVEKVNVMANSCIFQLANRSVEMMEPFRIRVPFPRPGTGSTDSRHLSGEGVDLPQELSDGIPIHPPSNGEWNLRNHSLVSKSWESQSRRRPFRTADIRRDTFRRWLDVISPGNHGLPQCIRSSLYVTTTTARGEAQKRHIAVL